MNEHDFDKDFFTIGEFAEIVDSTTETLRHYDRKGIFKPSKRGIMHENQYRLYSPTQITMVKMIRVLAEIGVPIGTIEELAENRSPEMLMKLLNKHKTIVADELRFLHNAQSIISTYFDLLVEGMSATETEISVSEIPEKRIILGGKCDYTGTESFYREFMRFCYELTEPKLNLASPMGGYFDSMDEFVDAPSKPSRFFAIDPAGHEKRAAGLYLIGYTRGYYGQANDLPMQMVEFAKNNGLVFSGPVYNIFLFDEMSISDPDNYLSQVMASVKETKRVPSRRPARLVRSGGL